MPDSPTPPLPRSDNFVHLHVHTEYSMLDGAARIDELMINARAQGMTALATTDHGYLYGAYEFWSKARKHGIKPIIGVEAYVTPGTHRSDKSRIKWGDGGRDDIGGNGAYTHMTLLARTTAGMHNLFRLSSLASLEGHYYKPRADRDLLSRHGEGLIGTTGCVGGEVQTRLRFGQYAEAKQAASDLQDIFGKVTTAEVMDYGIAIERQTSGAVAPREGPGPAVARDERSALHKQGRRQGARSIALRPAATLNDPNRFKFDGDTFYLRPAEMRSLFKELPQACDNTLLTTCARSPSSSRRGNTCPASLPPGE